MVTASMLSFGMTSMGQGFSVFLFHFSVHRKSDPTNRELPNPSNRKGRARNLVTAISNHNLLSPMGFRHISHSIRTVNILRHRKF